MGGWWRLYFAGAVTLLAGNSAHAGLSYSPTTVLQGVRVVLVSGRFEASDDLQAFVSQMTALGASTLVFDSPGGQPEKAMEFGRLIRRLGYDTYQPRQYDCASACALAFLGGVKRTAEPGAIGVHQTRFTDTTGLDPDAAVEEIQRRTSIYIAYVKEMGVDPGLIELALQYTSNDIRYLSGSEMASLHVTTDDTAEFGSDFFKPLDRPSNPEPAPPATHSPEPAKVAAKWETAELTRFDENGNLTRTFLGKVRWSTAGLHRVKAQVEIPTQLNAAIEIGGADLLDIYRRGQISVAIQTPYVFGPRGLATITAVWVENARGAAVPIKLKKVSATSADASSVAFGGEEEDRNWQSINESASLCVGLRFQAGGFGFLCLQKGESGQSIIQEGLAPYLTPKAVSAPPSTELVPLPLPRTFSDPPPASNSQAAIAFAAQCQAEWSQPNDMALALLADAYADPVTFYGKLRSRADVMEEKRQFAMRWPRRTYTLRQGSATASCRNEICTVTGLVDWSAKSDTRGKSASGIASIELVIDASRNKILSEGGQTIKN